MSFEELMAFAIGTECSDVHITVGTHLAVRRYGALEILPECPTAEESRNMIFAILTQEQVCVSGGQRGVQIKLAPADLIKAVDAVVCDLVLEG